MYKQYITNKIRHNSDRLRNAKKTYNIWRLCLPEQLNKTEAQRADSLFSCIWQVMQQNLHSINMAI